tara:strand:+ start:10321 stop:11355 length:1035 start_codon:yes stop_codon:yes gene_type:complete
MVKVYRRDLVGSYDTGGYWTDPETGEKQLKDLAWYQSKGYSTSPPTVEERSREGGTIFMGHDTAEDYGEETTISQTGESSTEYGYAVGQSLYKFFPESVLKEFGKAWAKYGDKDMAIGAVRQTPAWKNEFKYLEREDGSLIMTELEALATKATYRETLAEVGIIDTTDFENKFNELITGEVSGAEFQQRVDMVHNSVKNNIPEVEQLFRDRYGISTDSPTIFAALINPEIEEKLLKGDIETLTIQAEAKRAGFSGSFSKFEELRKSGLGQQQARGLYQGAETVMNVAARAGGRDIGLEAIEQAAMGDASAQESITLASAETKGQSSAVLGPTKKGKKVTGLLEE